MMLWDIAKGAEVQIKAEKDDAFLNFYSTVCFVNNNILFVKEIKTPNSEKAVSFADQKVKLTLMLPKSDDKVPLIWDNIVVKHILYKGNKYHIIVSQSKGRRFNRRGGYRIYVGLTGMLQKGPNTPTIEVILKDVSISGFGFISNDEIGIGKHVHLVVISTKYKFNLEGIVARKSIYNRKQVYGCKITKADKNLAKYIATKQREEINGKIAKTDQYKNYNKK